MSTHKHKGSEHAAAGAVPAGEVPALLRFQPGDMLAQVDPASTPGFEGGGKQAGAAALAAGTAQVRELQERLYAEGTAGGERSVLLVLQGMDTAGKGGIVRHVLGTVDLQGVRHTAFAAPTEAERGHGFLWRIRHALPRPGQIGVFDRSHYEDVLVARVDQLVPEAQWRSRYDAINRFETQLAASGTAVVKVLLQLSREEQKERLGRRLDRPDKHWKFDPHDIDVRLRWDDYQQAYQEALDRCTTADAPWYVVPADHKWYARWAVQQLLLTRLRELDPQWPAATFDIETQRRRLADS